MSTQFETATTIEASPSKVWETLGNLEGISNWAAIITDSPVTGASGVGAKRECTLLDGVVVKEEILGYDPGETLRYSIGGDLPVRNMVATWTLRAEGDATVAKYHGKFDAEPEMAEPLKEKLSGMAAFLLAALKANVETGEVLVPPPAQ